MGGPGREGQIENLVVEKTSGKKGTLNNVKNKVV